MMYSRPWRADGKVGGERVLSELMRVVSKVSKQAQPEIFAHVQPHAHATAKLSCHFAAFLRLDLSRGPTLKELEIGAYMHDIGKFFIASSILLKPGALDEEERAMISLHSVYGATVISKFPGVTETIRSTVLHHHERWDGSGYPEGLSGTSIPLAARIVSVVDVYTSLRAKRSYKPKLTKRQALSSLIEMAGHELDPHMVEDFIKLIRHERTSAGHDCTSV
ncbi:MAG TPA: HD domain-containing phosphohydrolase [Pyrinomonadaceae bacterium]|nr:HD domain-containing phosphohydrolase [Pyrinomonadaceae bacterium]